MITDAELQYAYPETINDTGTNGGPPSSLLIPDASLKNVFDHAFKSERDVGSTKYRKIFLKVGNADGDTLYNALAWLDNVTAADDFVCFFDGTWIDTQADIVGTETKYGCGTLNTDVSASGQTLIVDVEDSALASGNDVIFHDPGKIRITDKTDISDGTGNEEVHDVDTISWNGTQATITIIGTLANAYATADNTRVMSANEAGDIVPTVDTYNVTSGDSGTFDDTTYPVIVDSIGGLYGVVTLSFTDATNFTATGTESFANLTLGSGTTGSNFAPQNAEFTRNIFEVDYRAFGGTFQSGDTVVFTVKPPMYSVWEKRVIPALSDSLSNNQVSLVFTGEGA